MTEFHAKTLLVVDDEEDLREILAYQLKKLGHRVLEADGGGAALRMVEQEPVDAILSDVRMAGGDGIELLKNVRQRDPTTPPMALMTGFSDTAPELCFELGAVACLAKPFALADLAEVLDYLLMPPELRWTRKSRRRLVEAPVELNLVGAAAGPVAASTFNLGSGGMFVRWDPSGLKVGQELAFRFALPDEVGGEVSGKGLVRWIRANGDEQLPVGIGVEFLELSPADAARLGTYLTRISARTFIPSR
ncbi:MAG: response regulator [Bdellovibrionales bacterium]|nr:response regulator [Bdellovibrionales bacterium]